MNGSITKGQTLRPSKVYPTGTDGVTVQKGTGVWIEGSFTEIVPVDTITESFYIRGISIEDVSVAGVYELSLYYGLTDIECGRVRITKTASMDPTLSVEIETPILAANSRIRAKLDGSPAGIEDTTISISYR